MVVAGYKNIWKVWGIGWVLSLIPRLFPEMVITEAVHEGWNVKHDRGCSYLNISHNV